MLVYSEANFFLASTSVVLSFFFLPDSFQAYWRGILKREEWDVSAGVKIGWRYGPTEFIGDYHDRMGKQAVL